MLLRGVSGVGLSVEVCDNRENQKNSACLNQGFEIVQNIFLHGFRVCVLFCLIVVIFGWPAYREVVLSCTGLGHSAAVLLGARYGAVYIDTVLHRLSPERMIR